jgi:nitrogen fixation NifU-like protein
MYSAEVIDHFTHPRNVGFIADASVAVQYGDPRCGDCLLIFLKIERGIIEEMKYKVLGCAAAIASASMTSVLATGRFLEEALQLEEQAVAEALGGLPAKKMHCSNLAVGALRAAIRVYRDGAGSPREADPLTP